MSKGKKRRQPKGLAKLTQVSSGNKKALTNEFEENSSGEDFAENNIQEEQPGQPEPQGRKIKKGFIESVMWNSLTILITFGVIVVVAGLYTTYIEHGNSIFRLKNITIGELLTASVAILSALFVEYVYHLWSNRDEEENTIKRSFEMEPLVFLAMIAGLILLDGVFSYVHKVHEFESSNQYLEKTMILNLPQISRKSTGEIIQQLKNPEKYQYLKADIEECGCMCKRRAVVMIIVAIGMSLVVRFRMSHEH